jgi:hypothetical protein
MVQSTCAFEVYGVYPVMTLHVGDVEHLNDLSHITA